MLIGALNFIVDPLQIFRPARLYPAMYSSNDRMQAAGLIQSQDFSAVFIGTSLAVHYRASAIGRSLGLRTVKLAMSGSNSREQSFVLAAALAKKPQLVLWEMDDWIFREAPDPSAYLPTDLYDRNIKGLSSYLLSLSMARESLGIAVSRIGLAWLHRRFAQIGVLKFHNENLDEHNTLPEYFDLSETYNSRKTLASYFHYKVHPSQISAGYDCEAMARNFERDAISLIASHPNTRFKIFFPPYSILHFVAMRDASPDTLKIFYQLNRNILQRLSQLQNVEIFDFRAVKEITHSLQFYADVVHHSPIVDTKVLSLLKYSQYRVDPAEPEASIDRLTEQLLEYQSPTSP